ncbi:DUF2849 domain-containing protein [Hansschlegelia zhihuaiae]|uniref:DUF2849 domain-containing protein n=1 Tax=Hansschlegelia zhihuaiae TaxID=405005 RepID=A0A4Q0M674_9HYPH|nr:DUF2849 domain-containing protein [Hansschlegelia zhihuaiae]RXF68475.1 DUF2849 domain-containing protein [Hansschlegelia zhihuaiae]
MSAPIQKSAAKTRAATQVVTGNRLTDGVVVYLDSAGGWSERLNDARVVEGAEALEAALAAGKAAEAAQVVVEAYPIDVKREPDGLRALRVREDIRARGPSVRVDLERPLGA